jgi:hypothetical protein
MNALRNGRATGLFGAVLFLAILHAEELPHGEVDHLVKSIPIWSGDPNAMEEWRHEVRTRDIKPDLIAMVKKARLSDDWEAVGLPMAALRERNDLTKAELDDLLEPVYQMRITESKVDIHPRAYAVAAIGLLRNYPSPEHEDLILSFIGKSEGDFDEYVAETLALMGTQRSLGPLQALAAEKKPSPGSANRLYDTLQEAIIRIENREKVGAPDQDEKVQKPEPSSTPASSNAIDSKARESDSFSSYPGLWVFGAGILATLILMSVWLVKKRNS